MSVWDADTEAEIRAADDEEQRTPAQRALHAAFHHGSGFSHGCDGSWLDDHGWDRLADALVAAGWTPPEVETP